MKGAWVSHGADFEPVYSEFAEDSTNLETLMVRIPNRLCWITTNYLDLKT
jgi:hypothetical protein